MFCKKCKLPKEIITALEVANPQNGGLGGLFLDELKFSLKCVLFFIVFSKQLDALFQEVYSFKRQTMELSPLAQHNKDALVTNLANKPI